MRSSLLHERPARASKVGAQTHRCFRQMIGTQRPIAGASTNRTARRAHPIGEEPVMGGNLLTPGPS